LPAITTLIDVVPGLPPSLEPTAVRALALRVRITTGININEPRADQLADPVAIRKVCDALRSMGYPIDDQ
jgi:hypothetical protein